MTGVVAAADAQNWCRMNGREERIRTSGLLLPKQALYQAELPPDEGSFDGMGDHADGAFGGQTPTSGRAFEGL